MRAWIRAGMVAGSLLLFVRGATAQATGSSQADEKIELPKIVPGVSQLAGDLVRYSKMSAVAGYEHELISEVREEVKEFGPKIDNLGNLIVTIGSGAPRRLIVAPVDEPGYVVSDIMVDGYLRVQRLPQAPPNPVFDTLHFAQPIVIRTRANKLLPGVFSGLSVHLQPGRVNAPKMNHPEELYVDIGARSAEEVHSAGVDLLDPIVLATAPEYVGEFDFNVVGGNATGDRFGVAVLLELLSKLRLSKTIARNGTTTVAFVTQSWTGGRGLNRLLEEVHPDEMIYIGRLTPPAAQGPGVDEKSCTLGEGVLLGVGDARNSLTGLAAQIRELSGKKGVPLKVVSAQKPRLAGYAKTSEFPERFVQLGVATLRPATPGETVSVRDVQSLEQLLEGYLHISAPPRKGVPGGECCGVLAVPSFPDIVKAYGASGHEGAVRAKVLAALPEWAWKKVTTDPAGNLILHLGDAKQGTKAPKIAFVAHLDEIGYEVKSIEPDGRLLVEVLGGGYTEYFLGHAVLVHTDKEKVGGVLELPEGWDKPGFEWPHGPKTMDEPVHVYVGTHSAEETAKLGIKPGDWVTIPKEYRPLLGTRANGRSFDDRVGCAALIEAVKALGPELPERDVTFIWSTEEEVGLKGAAAAAERMAKEGNTPDFVFAIDTFVSSDAPLESKRFADAELGKGFVVRAVDNSNITPREYVDHVVKLAQENNIPAQYGVTGGGNDGSVFLRYGAVNIPLGWPLRYSHSPAEVIDTRDLDALAKIVAVLAKRW